MLLHQVDHYYAVPVYGPILSHSRRTVNQQRWPRPTLPASRRRGLPILGLRTQTLRDSVDSEVMVTGATPVTSATAVRSATVVRSVTAASTMCGDGEREQ